MARSPKVGAATVAALVFLVVGVEVASAGLVDDVVADPLAAVEVPVADVEVPVADVEVPVAEVTQAADEAVADAKQAVDEAVADAPLTATAVVETAREVVAATPVAQVVDKVEKAVQPVDDIINPVVAQVAESSKALTAPGQPSAAGAEPSAPTTAEAGSPVSAATTGAVVTPSGSEPAAGAGSQASSPASSAPSMTTPMSTTQEVGLQPVLLPRTIVPFTAPQSSSERRDGSSNAPWAPFFPLVPVQPSTASAGTAGALLVAALIAAFMFRATRTGRLARPWPILLRPQRFLSLLERPG